MLLPEKNIQTRLGESQSIATGRRGDGGGMFFFGGKRCWDIRVSSLVGKKSSIFCLPIGFQKKNMCIGWLGDPFFWSHGGCVCFCFQREVFGFTII